MSGGPSWSRVLLADAPDSNGITYELRCNTGHATTHWRNEPCPSLRECADRCAKDPECYSCDQHHTSNTCSFKKAPAVTAVWADGDTWFPVACPDVRATQAVKEPEIASNLTCPTSTSLVVDEILGRGRDGRGRDETC